MSTIKVDKLQGTSGSATGLTFSGANGTFGGTLAVSGVHTVGNNAIYTSDGGAVTQNLVQGLMKAWINFNGSGTIAIRDSFNITSITDNGTGDYDVTIANDMANANYATLFGGGEGGDANSGGRIPNLAIQTTSVMDVYCMNLDNGASDGVVQNLGFLGDLA